MNLGSIGSGKCVPMLLGARVLQGVGGALAMRAALALVTAVFPVEAEPVKALGIWGALSGLGFAVGILLGGAITEAASWRWVFLINVPSAPLRPTRRRRPSLAGDQCVLSRPPR